MKTVRFSKVVEKCGRPDVYLLMTETDAKFQKSLHADKIMSLSGDSHGAGTEYGTVGYDKKRKGQLLLFPKPLKSFAEMKVVGIKYDLFAKVEPSEQPGKLKSRNKKTEKLSPAKVIRFPEPEDDDEDESISHLRTYARQAMHALERNNSVAAYNLLKRIVRD